MEFEKREMPIYVKIEEYKDILDIMNLIKSKLAEAKATMGKINEIKNEEDSELELWRSELEEVERKINFIDKALFEPEMH
jgi:hypothetical protein